MGDCVFGVFFHRGGGRKEGGRRGCDRTTGHPNNVNTTGFRVSFFFVLLFSLVVNFLHVGGRNMSVVAARNAWVSNFVCLCVMENRSSAERWMVEGATTLKKGLCN
jgi:hypothetical protein